MAVRNEDLFGFILGCAALLLAIFLLLPAGSLIGAETHIDPVQVQMLIDTYKDQLLFFKVSAGTVIAAQTTAIVWLAKRLLNELAKKRR